MKKLQQFWILKFESDRLKGENNKININLDSARRNDEIISISYNQVIQSIFRLKNRIFDQNLLDPLLNLKKKCSRLPNDKENQDLYNQLSERIDEILFIPELVSIQFSNKAHYEKIYRDGLLINGKSYVRLLAGAGNIRKNTVIFCDAEIRDALVTILNNGRDQTQKLVPAKYNAYFSLLNSSILPVSFPRFCVVKDCFLSAVRPMDYITTDPATGRDMVEENKAVAIEANSFDGQGLISPRLSQQWAEELELDYLPASFIIRAPFIKGMVCTFDFHAFAKYVARTNDITDIYGNLVDVNQVDLILSESQFKLWQGYPSLEAYLENCAANMLGFGISRVATREDKTYARSNYQFLQVLKLDDQQVEALCEPTVDYFESLLGGDADKMLLSSLGSTAIRPGKNWFSALEATTKALVLNREAAKDPHIKNYFANTLNKRIRESYLGSLYFEGNYSILISDPYAQAQHIFSLPVTGLLKEFQHYSAFWNRRGVQEVAACRAPLTFQTEIVTLHFQENDQVNHWYRYLTTGIVIPAFGIGMDCVRFADADHDGDLIATYRHPAFLAGVQDGLPITYAKKSATKLVIDNNEVLSQADINGFGCRVGYITNISSSIFCLQEQYPEGSKEREAIFNRLKIARKLQGDEIDHGKGVEINPFPEHWVKYRKVTETMPPLEKEAILFENALVVDKRPLFFRFLYPHYEKKYQKEIKNFDHHASDKFGISFLELLKQATYTPEEMKLINNYYRQSFFIHTSSIMNRISLLMQERVKEAKADLKGSFDFGIYLDRDIPLNEDKLETLLSLYGKYKAYRKPQEGGEDREGFWDYLKKEAGQITNCAAELANLAVYICYSIYPKSSKTFCWQIAEEGIIQNLIKNSHGSVFLPVMKQDGDIEFLWKRYALEEFTLEEFIASS